MSGPFHGRIQNFSNGIGQIGFYKGFVCKGLDADFFCSLGRYFFLNSYTELPNCRAWLPLFL